MIQFIPLFSGSSGNAYLLAAEGKHLLLEAGIGYPKLQQALWERGVDISKLDGCLISHHHGDHAKAAWGLLDHGIEVYASEETLVALCRKKNEGPHHRMRTLHSRELHLLGDKWSVTPFDVKHDEGVGCLGFEIDADGERLVFITDALFCRYTFDDVAVWALEANYDPEILRSNIERGSLPAIVAQRTVGTHMSIDTALGILAANDLSRTREIVLLHLSDGNSNAEDFQRRAEAATGVPTRIA